MLDTDLDISPIAAAPTANLQMQLVHMDKNNLSGDSSKQLLNSGGQTLLNDSKTGPPMNFTEKVQQHADNPIILLKETNEDLH